MGIERSKVAVKARSVRDAPRYTKDGDFGDCCLHKFPFFVWNDVDYPT